MSLFFQYFMKFKHVYRGSTCGGPGGIAVIRTKRFRTPTIALCARMYVGILWRWYRIGVFAQAINCWCFSLYYTDTDNGSRVFVKSYSNGKLNDLFGRNNVHTVFINQHSIREVRPSDYYCYYFLDRRADTLIVRINNIGFDVKKKQQHICISNKK